MRANLLWSDDEQWGKIKPFIPMNRPAGDCHGGEPDDKKLFGGGTYHGAPLQVTPAGPHHARDPGRQIAKKPIRQAASKAASTLSAATAGSRISGALPRATTNSHQTFFHHLPRRRRGQLAMGSLSPDPDQSWPIRFPQCPESHASARSPESHFCAVFMSI
jgi:hypothetical protein